jgi:antitoxin (DNA-binding transcriptional repressor) of toxin-antitoxin stability system
VTKARLRVLKIPTTPILQKEGVSRTMVSVKMPSLTLSQLRNTGRLLAWLRAGKTIELRERDRVIANIVAVKEARIPGTQEPSRSSGKVRRDLGRILRRVDRLPVLEDRTPDEIINYDKDGLPR